MKKEPKTKVAQLAASREWKARNKEKMREYQKLWRQNNKELAKELTKTWREANKPHLQKYSKQYVEKNPDYHKNKHLMSTYGMSLDEYNERASSQNYRCAVCGKHAEDTQRKRLYVDHCHKTGVIRGLLCSHCNSALGMVNDDTDILFALVSYINEYKYHQI